MTNNTDYLRGPWHVVLADRDGFVYDSLTDLIQDHADADEVSISIRRGTALPVADADVDQGDDDDMDNTRLPGSYKADDLIEIFDDYVEEGAEMRWAQAQAMAAGLNAAGGAA